MRLTAVLNSGKSQHMKGSTSVLWERGKVSTSVSYIILNTALGMSLASVTQSSQGVIFRYKSQFCLCHGLVSFPRI